jgi:hypothetical protein
MTSVMIRPHAERFYAATSPRPGTDHPGLHPKHRHPPPRISRTNQAAPRAFSPTFSITQRDTDRQPGAT